MIMIVELTQNIYGRRQERGSLRIHANKDDRLKVLIEADTHVICDSKYYPNEHIPIFSNQGILISETKDKNETEFEEDLDYGTLSE